MKIFDAHSLLAGTPKPIPWLLKGILPAGSEADFFGAPGDGKTTLTQSLAMAIASGTGNWFGRPCASGKVIVLGGERSGPDVLQRDLHRSADGLAAPPGQLLYPFDDNEDCPPLWVWARNRNHWMQTQWGQEVSKWISAEKPVAVFIDTIGSVTCGGDPIDGPQQYALVQTLAAWSKSLGGFTTITVSHSNQLSSRDDLHRRLDYRSRVGSNGFPGKIRWIAGVSALRPEDALARQLGLEDRAAKTRLIAVGVSKHNEMGRSDWTPEAPAIFDIDRNGRLSLVLEAGCGTKSQPPLKPTAEHKGRRLAFAEGSENDDF